MLAFASANRVFLEDDFLFQIKDQACFPFTTTLLYNVDGFDANLTFEELPEVWKPWYLNSYYQVSTHGRVATRDGQLIREFKNSKGYASVWLKCGDFPWEVHKMVLRSHRHNPLPKTNPVIDHIDGDRMNSRIENLRYCNNYLNGHNKLGVKGYSRDRRTGKFVTCIRCETKKIHLGVYESESEARAVYREASARLYEVL